MNIEEIETLREKLQSALTELIGKIGTFQIGRAEQFPFGWRKAAKGRTVWRILEELITQNLEKHHKELGIESITASESEVTIYDFRIVLAGEKVPVYVNIKSAVSGGKSQKDDICKGLGLKAFYEADVSREFFVTSFCLKFNEDMSIAIEKCIVFPVAWIPDIYVNPSNNGNLQSSKYKDIQQAARRTTAEFYELFKKALEESSNKKAAKLAAERKALEEIVEVVELNSKL
jgi:hypothetical protein